jgi:tetratricopeptide (TPR) repeat protein
MTRPPNHVTENEIKAAERLRGRGEYATALSLTQDMLRRVQDDGDMRMRLLFDVLYCSTRLCADSITNEAIHELEQMPQPKMSRIFIDFIQAMTYIAHGRYQEGLHLIDANLKSEFMERESFLVEKYRHLAYRGDALTGLARCDEALESLNEAHLLFPDGESETAILIDQSNCLTVLERYDDAYAAANLVLNRGDAECRMWQSRVPEALELYAATQKRLPCRLVQEERIQKGITNAMAYLEKLHPLGKPS